jgi:hypothetical protein
LFFFSSNCPCEKVFFLLLSIFNNSSVIFISSLFIDVSFYHNSKRKIRKELVFTLTIQAIITVALNSFKIFLFSLHLSTKKRGKRGGVGCQPMADALLVLFQTRSVFNKYRY